MKGTSLNHNLEETEVREVNLECGSWIFGQAVPCRACTPNAAGRCLSQEEPSLVLASGPDVTHTSTVMTDTPA